MEKSHTIVLFIFVFVIGIVLLAAYYFESDEKINNFLGDENIPQTETRNTLSNNKYVKFRTIKIDYSTGNAVAFNPSCDGSKLNRYGRTHETCYAHKCSEAAELLVPAGNIQTKFWSGGQQYVCICDVTIQSDIEPGYSRKYLSADSDAEKVDSSVFSINVEYEVAC